MNTKPKPRQLDNNMNFILTQFYFYSTVYTYSKFTKLNSVKSTFFETLNHNFFQPCDNDELVHYKDSINKADSSLINIKTRKLDDLIEIQIKISSKRDFRGFLIKARRDKKPVGIFETQNGTVWKVKGGLQ